MGRTAKIVGGFRPPIPGPTSTGPDCSSGTSNFAGSTSSSTSTGPDCSSGTSNFAGSTSSSGPTDRSIDNYAWPFPPGRTGAHPHLTSAIHQSFPDCETDACNFPHPCLTWSGRFTTGYHFYDKSQAFACSTSCTMPSGLMRYRVVITFSEFIINHSPLDFSLRFSL